MYWLYVHTLTGAYLNFWSGIGSDFGEYVIVVGIVVGLYHGIRHSQCKVTRCWRIGLHKTVAGHRVCRKHHPDDRLTHNDVLEAHNAAVTKAARSDTPGHSCTVGVPADSNPVVVERFDPVGSSDEPVR